MRGDLAHQAKEGKESSKKEKKNPASFLLRLLNFERMAQR
jgi:hypothetical protein